MPSLHHSQYPFSSPSSTTSLLLTTTAGSMRTMTVCELNTIATVLHNYCRHMAKSVNFEVLRGLTNALLAAKRPDEAVKVLLVSRERLHSKKSQGGPTKVDDSATEELLEVDPIQVELLLGKAYADWGHVTDAVSVYDRLISNHPDDFRGYLAKGIILKENGNVGAAERMFIQARFFAPQNAKVLVDRYSRQ